MVKNGTFASPAMALASSLTGTGRANHQHTARDTTTQALELARIAQELDQLAHFFLGFVATCNVSQCGLDLVFGQQARLALAKAHRPALATRTTLHLAHEEHEHGDDDQDREAGDQQLRPDALLLWLLAFDNHVVVDQVTDQAIVGNGRAHGLEVVAVGALAGNDVAVDGHTLDLAILDLLDEVGIVEGLRLVRLEKLFITVTRTAAMINHRIRFFAMSFNSLPSEAGARRSRASHDIHRPNLLHYLRSRRHRL